MIALLIVTLSFGLSFLLSRLLAPAFLALFKLVHFGARRGNAPKVADAALQVRGLHDSAAISFRPVPSLSRQFAVTACLTIIFANIAVSGPQQLILPVQIDA